MDLSTLQMGFKSGVEREKGMEFTKGQSEAIQGILNEYWQRQETHHVWGNGCGPTEEMNRIEHTLVHQHMAEATAEVVGKKSRGGFCGDYLTRKDINPPCNFDGSRIGFEQPSIPTFNSPLILNTFMQPDPPKPGGF